jgi:putative transposase
MPNYRRDYSGHIWFFTIVTHNRVQMLTSEEARRCLRKAINDCREKYPFKIDAWVLLPDHLHCIWDLSEEDLNYSRRWSIIKRKFTQAFRRFNVPNPPFWQKRFWAHHIDNDGDYEGHLNYIHYNPVKHGYVKAPREWPWTSFHRFAESGRHATNWGEYVNISQEIGRE